MKCGVGSCKKHAELRCEHCGALYCDDCALLADYECDCVDMPKIVPLKDKKKK